jgi:hypothetical protein
MIPILMLPIAVAAWLFSARATALCLVATYLVDALLVTTVTQNLLWPPYAIIVFTLSALAMTAEACGVSMLRYALDYVQMVRQKEQRAEQELASALKRQRVIGELKDQFFLNMSHELYTPLGLYACHIISLARCVAVGWVSISANNSWKVWVGRSGSRAPVFLVRAVVFVSLFPMLLHPWSLPNLRGNICFKLRIVVVEIG